jgi:hypothetical protein
LVQRIVASISPELPLRCLTRNVPPDRRRRLLLLLLHWWQVCLLLLRVLLLLLLCMLVWLLLLLVLPRPLQVRTSSSTVLLPWRHLHDRTMGFGSCRQQ